MYKARYRRILGFFARMLLGFLWWDILLPRVGFRKAGRRSLPRRMRQAASSFRVLAIQMGGVMIKVGQFLSARLDVLPLEVTDELSGLQDEVAPEPFENVRKVVESEFGESLETLFAEFDVQPRASASIGQVHGARLLSGEGSDTTCESMPVVVKVQRPDIEKLVEVDLNALRVVSRWLMYYKPISKRANVPVILEEFSRSLHEEIDYLTEGKNAETFAENFADEPDILVPKVCWSRTTRRVLTLEDVQAIKITDYEAIDAAGVSRKEVADRLFDTYLKQIFEDRFFHADPHPGNLFVLPESSDEAKVNRPWKLVFVDFGMVGRVPSSLFDGLREGLIGLATKDSKRIIHAYQLMGILLPGADVQILEQIGDRLFERFWGKSTTDMMDMHPEEAHQFVQEFGEVLYELPFQAPENMILFVRCLGILSGMCTGLNPDFNLWSGLSPYAARLVAAEGKGKVQTVLKEAEKILQTIISLPGRTEQLISRIERGELRVQDPEGKKQLTRLNRSVRKTAGAVVFAAFFLGSIQLYMADAGVMTWVALAASGLTLIWMIFS
jgi:predicted unusual protein kinase regulating ubiquinone biosynthesis (AarF/ABC1/UbiB family)